MYVGVPMAMPADVSADVFCNRAVHGARHAEVGDDAVLAHHEHVFRLDVAVDDAHCA